MSAPTDDPLMSVMEQEYSMNSSVDPKNMQELTIYVSIRPVLQWSPSKTPGPSIAGPEPLAERPGQIPDHVRPDNLTH